MPSSGTARREFLRFLAYSPLVGYFGMAHWSRAAGAVFQEDESLSPKDATNVFQFHHAARQKLEKPVYDFIAGGADDLKTLHANRRAFDELQIRVRRLIDVSRIDTSVRLFGQTLENPIILAPVGSQRPMHAEGELASARGAASRKHLFIASTVASYSVGEIVEAGQRPVWFQLYPTRDRGITGELLQRADAAGCPVMALTVDTPVVGNRERQAAYIKALLESGPMQLGNFEGIPLPDLEDFFDPSMTWDMIDWLKARTTMKVLLKGIVTREDAKLSVERGADGIIVSNHGGRQEESNRGTIECLPEIVDAVAGRIPVLIDGGFRRGTDIFKALALGADAICIGRPYIWGLAAFGQPGVEQVLDLLKAELVRIMQLAGTRSLGDINQHFVEWQK
jgi:isopentenyl diphosphate isomerase/L-lactate dehydrogenase-like FMN-dependent dehydrogenase